MHEFSITQNILAIALEKANEANASKITQINIVVGELSGIASECVQFYFDFLSQDTIAAEAGLNFTKIPFQLRCSGCATIFSPDGFDWTCPKCGGQRSEAISGGECYLDSIEVE